MREQTTAPAALLMALALAQEHGSAAEALRLTGLDLDDLERYGGLPADLAARFARLPRDEAVEEALAFGFLAGRAAHRPRPRRSVDTTAFLMDHDLVCRGAEGRSILRLPWFEEELFVGCVLPDIEEMPRRIRDLAATHYRSALAGERGRFEFASCGHAYIVDAVPVRAIDDRIRAVLGIARPAPLPAGRLRVAALYERVAEELERTARLREQRADALRGAGDGRAEERERDAAAAARKKARRAQARAFRMRSNWPHAGD